MPSSAQSQPTARERQERRVTLPSNPEEPGPEVSVATGVTTYLRFDAALDRAAVEVEGRSVRFKWVEVGDTLIALEPSVDLGAEEKLVVRVRYRDGASPARATLALVTRPGTVDKEVEVVRRPRTLEALETALVEKEAEFTALKAHAGASGPAGLIFSGRIDQKGVQARKIEKVPSFTQGGLNVTDGMGYRAGPWALAVIHVRNLPGQKPWAPASALLSREDGSPVKVRAVEMDKAQLGPGEEGVVAVESEAPSWEEGQKFLLQVMDKSGTRQLPLLEVKL
jgi:uncharacterized protein (TIGR02268 family)